MDIVELLKSEHKKVNSHLDRLLNSRPGSSKTRQLEIQRLKEALIPHMEGEEELLYPLLIEDEDTKELGFEAAEQHRAARNVLFDVEEMNADDERWHARMKVCSDLLKLHIEVEEKVILEIVSDLLDQDQRKELAKQFQAFKKHRLAS